MSAVETLRRLDLMANETNGDVKAVLRTLRLAKAQLELLKRQFAKDQAKATVIADMEVALELIIKKLNKSTS